MSVYSDLWKDCFCTTKFCFQLLFDVAIYSAFLSSLNLTSSFVLTLKLKGPERDGILNPSSLIFSGFPRTAVSQSTAALRKKRKRMCIFFLMLAWSISTKRCAQSAACSRKQRVLEWEMGQGNTVNFPVITLQLGFTFSHSIINSLNQTEIYVIQKYIVKPNRILKNNLSCGIISTTSHPQPFQTR